MIFKNITTIRIENKPHSSEINKIMAISITAVYIYYVSHFLVM